MSSRKFLPGLAILLVCSAAVLPRAARTAAGPTTWPPISAEDAAMTDCPREPGAPAVILYREEITDVDKGTTTVFKRLKILTAAGRDHSSIEIPFVAGYSKITEIEARVVQPGGQARPFDGEIFERTDVRRGKLRLAAKTFALPNIEVGSIIDYRYKIVSKRSGLSAKRLNALINDLTASEDRPEEGGAKERKDPRTLPVGRWTVQDDLFTKHLKFSYKNTMAGIAALLGEGGRLGWASVGMESGRPFVFLGNAQMELYNVPSFAAEDSMIPEAVARMSVDLFFIDHEIANGAEFWKLESRDWQRGVEEFLGRPDQLAAAARRILGDETDPMEQLKRIYAEVHGFRNLSYEKDLTDERKKDEKIKGNRRVEDVLERRYGLRSDITRTFVSLARAAGFEAEVVRVTARDDKLFRKDLLSFYDQLDSEIALVKVAGRTLAFDPATPFCPFGLIHWTRTNSTGLRMSENPPAFFTTPSSPPDMTLTKREIALSLDTRGGLAGTIKTTYTGQEALVRRLDHIHDDDAARREALETELRALLPAGATARLTDVENIDNNEPALIVTCAVDIPGLATVAGDKTLLPLSPLAGSGQYPFRHAARKYPVCFAYPSRQFDDIQVTLPEGLTAAALPPPRKNDSDFSSFSVFCAQEAPNRLHIQRDLSVKKIYFAIEQYPALKAFLDQVRAIDEEQIVLTPTATSLVSFSRWRP
ncbi:MAG TPA: DUF3857 and transglutaminase domain-containing protein [Acidobacteriota bacterium]|nr:DUF3857 and transglutaminase domain-containing protein [Acidobacteriota bacterium]